MTRYRAIITGASGGLGRRTREAVIVLEAAGYDLVIIETVGTGQAEIAVTELSDIVLLVVVGPGGRSVGRRCRPTRRRVPIRSAPGAGEDASGDGSAGGRRSGRGGAWWRGGSWRSGQRPGTTSSVPAEYAEYAGMTSSR